MPLFTAGVWRRITEYSRKLVWRSSSRTFRETGPRNSSPLDCMPLHSLSVYCYIPTHFCYVLAGLLWDDISVNVFRDIVFATNLILIQSHVKGSPTQNWSFSSFHLWRRDQPRAWQRSSLSLTLTESEIWNLISFHVHTLFIRMTRLRNESWISKQSA